MAEVAAILSMDPAAVAVDAPLDSLGMTSMAFVELLVAIEKNFDLMLMETDLTRDDFRTIGLLAACIARNPAPKHLSGTNLRRTCPAPRLRALYRQSLNCQCPGQEKPDHEPRAPADGL